MSVVLLHAQERRFPVSLRWLVGRMALWVGAFSAGGLLVLPQGLSVFAGALVVATLLALPSILSHRRPRLPGSIRWLVAVATVVLLTAGLSALASGAGWAALDTPSRVVLLPWCAWLAWMYRLQASSLGWGAISGLMLALVVSITEAGLGTGRTGGDANPIVFANAVLTLLVLAVFCRPALPKPVTRCLLTVMVAGAAVAITFSGSRGVLPGLALVIVVMAAGDSGGRWKRVIGASAVLLSLSALVWNLPWLSSQFRLDDMQMEVERYAGGDVDTPVGARLALWGVAWAAFRESPVSGVGIDGFASRVDASVHCQAGPRHFCELGHAHNDLAQWASTLGIAGIGALSLLYLAPLFLAARGLRDVAPHTSATKDVARACVVLVVVYALSGITQSMFAHALSASAYAIFVGLLLGTCSALVDTAAPAVLPRAER